MEEVMFKKILFQFTFIFLLAFSSSVLAEEASNPDPAGVAIDVSVTAVLSWTSGSGAASHDVYFDTNFDNVNTDMRPGGDADGNGQVDWADVWVLAEQWLLDPTGLYPCADFDGDNNVNGVDFAIIADSWNGQTGASFMGIAKKKNGKLEMIHEGGDQGI